MYRHGLLLLVALAPISADTPKQDPEKADVAALQGTWVLKTTEYLGEKADQDPTEDEIGKRWLRRAVMAEERELEEYLSERRTILEFKGRTADYRQWIRPLCGGEGGIRSFKGPYRLRAGNTPKILERQFETGREQTTVYSIYSIQGDTLLLCLSLSNDPKRLPKTFSTDKDEDVVLLTFRREKK